jgi:Protein of unknown function (DUF669)
MSLQKFLAQFDDDFREASGERQERKPIPEGEYLCKIVSFSAKKSQKGNPMFQWELEIADGEQKGRKVNHYNALVKNAMWKLKQDLVAAGVVLEKLSDFRTDMMWGREVMVKITPRPDKGYDTEILGQENMDDVPF